MPVKHKKYDWTGYTIKQRLFCYEYLNERNKTKAAINAGFAPKTAQQQSVKTYKKCEARIEEMINEIAAPHLVTADRIIQEFAKIGFMNAKDFFDDEGNPIAIQNLPDDAAAAIAGMKVQTSIDEEGETSTLKEYKLADKIDALTKLGQNLQMFTKKLVIEDKRPTVIIKDMTGRKKKPV